MIKLYITSYTFINLTVTYVLMLLTTTRKHSLWKARESNDGEEQLKSLEDKQHCTQDDVDA